MHLVRSDVRPLNRHGPQPRPYAELIESYDPRQDDDAAPGVSMSYYAEDYVESLFDEDEAKQLKAYIDLEHGHEGVTTITEVSLPVPTNIAGVGSIAVGGGNDILMAHKRPDYPLPFKVEAFYDLRGCEQVDGSDVYPY